MVGQSWMRMKRKATTGRTQRREVRNMVSHTLGWFREFLAVPGLAKTSDQQSKSHTREVGTNKSSTSVRKSAKSTHRWRGKRRWRWGTCHCCTWWMWWQSRQPGCPTQKTGSLPSSNGCPDTAVNVTLSKKFVCLLVLKCWCTYPSTMCMERVGNKNKICL